jgi:hypothetical protein
MVTGFLSLLSIVLIYFLVFQSDKRSTDKKIRISLETQNLKLRINELHGKIRLARNEEDFELEKKYRQELDEVLKLERNYLESIKD